MPVEYGGAGLGVSEASVMMHTVAKTGAMTACENGGDKLVHGSGGISRPRAE